MLKKRITLFGKTIPLLAPVAISLVVVSIVLATILITVTQHITQEITGVPPTNYGSISAVSFDLSPVQVNGGVTETRPGGVVVELAAAGENMWLHLKLEDSTTTDYVGTSYIVTLTSIGADNPTPGEITVSVTSTTDGTGGTIDESVQLGIPGTYIFSENITATAGPTPGDADVTVDVTLEDIE